MVTLKQVNKALKDAGLAMALVRQTVGRGYRFIRQGEIDAQATAELGREIRRIEETRTIVVLNPKGSADAVRMITTLSEYTVDGWVALGRAATFR